MCKRIETAGIERWGDGRSRRKKNVYHLQNNVINVNVVVKVIKLILVWSLFLLCYTNAMSHFISLERYASSFKSIFMGTIIINIISYHHIRCERCAVHMNRKPKLEYSLNKRDRDKKRDRDRKLESTLKQQQVSHSNRLSSNWYIYCSVQNVLSSTVELFSSARFLSTRVICTVHSHMIICVNLTGFSHLFERGGQFGIYIGIIMHTCVYLCLCIRPRA